MTKRLSAMELGSITPLKVFSQQEAEDLANRWMDVFGKNSEGVNPGAFMWHVFSGGRYRCIEGVDATARYKEQEAPEYIMLSNDCVHAVSTNALPLPEMCDRRDYYVFPSNFAWTMAFTHEAGWLGPYFAVHPNYDVLNKANLDAVRANVRKRQEIEDARRKGWM